jgi:hypothetical protein
MFFEAIGVVESMPCDSVLRSSMSEVEILLLQSLTQFVTCKREVRCSVQ